MSLTTIAKNVNGPTWMIEADAVYTSECGTEWVAKVNENRLFLARNFVEWEEVKLNVEQITLEKQRLKKIFYMEELLDHPRENELIAKQEYKKFLAFMNENKDKMPISQMVLNSGERKWVLGLLKSVEGK